MVLAYFDTLVKYLSPQYEIQRQCGRYQCHLNVCE